MSTHDSKETNFNINTSNDSCCCGTPSTAASCCADFPKRGHMHEHGSCCDHEHHSRQQESDHYSDHERHNHSREHQHDSCCDHEHSHEHQHGSCCDHEHSRRHQHHGCDHQHERCNHEHPDRRHDHSACCCTENTKHGGTVLDDIGCSCGSCAVSELQDKPNYLGELLKKVKQIPVLHRIGTSLILAALGFVHPLFFILSYIIAGSRVVLTSLSRINLLDEHFLMTIASLGAIAIGEYPEAAAVMILFEIGEYFTDRAVDKSKNAISGLLAMRPKNITLIRAGKEIVAAPEDARIGDTLFAKVGERIALDGVIMSERAVVDNSAISGESVPVSLKRGDQVFSGAVVLESPVVSEVTHRFEDSTISRIIALVENARERKTPTEQFITKFAKIYTPLVVAAAVAMTAIPTLLLGTDVFSEWLHRSLIFLVVSCPCALVISVPLSYFAGIGKASSLGVLFKGSSYLEAISHADRIVFDKTGTLTTGEFNVQCTNISDASLYPLIYAIEKTSSHPAAAAITRHIADVSSAGVMPQANMSEKNPTEIREMAGIGLNAKFADGTEISIGNIKIFEKSANAAEICANLNTTAVFVAKNGEYAGHFELGDALREDTKPAIEAISKDMKISLLSGDNKSVTKAVAAELGIEHYGAELMPEQKYETVRNFVENGEIVVFVGDGINDAPVLAGATIGISMGLSGSDAAIEASDAVLMKPGISAIPDVVKIARLTKRIVKQNIALSLGIKAAVLTLSAFGLANMWLAVIADVGSALTAVLNTLRISKNSKI